MSAYVPTFMVSLFLPAMLPTAQPTPLRFLHGADRAKAQELEKQITAAEKAEQWDRAIAAAKELAGFRRTRQGAQHWEVFDAQQQVQDLAANALRPPGARVALQRARQLGTEVNRLHTAGQAGVALAKAAESLAIRERYLAPKHPEIGTSLNNLAALFDAQAQYAKAEPLYQRALALREQSLPPGHPDIATSLSNLALLYHAQAQYAKAEPLLRRALALREQSLPPAHPDIAASLNNLAGLYRAQAQYAKAESLLQRALAIWEQCLAPGHPHIAASLNNLAGLYQVQGRYTKAEPLLQRALALREQNLPPGHPDIALSLNNLAGLYSAQAQYAKAEPLLQRALSFREQSLPSGHPDIAQSLNNLAGLYRAQAQYVKAEPLLERALAIGEQSLPPGHPDIARSLSGLAALYYAQARYAKAEPLLQRALAIREQNLPPGHPDIAESQSGLAALYYAQARYAKAEPLYQRALAIREQKLVPGHPDIARSLNNLAALYYAQAHYAKAEPLYQRALAVREQSLPPGHPDIALSLDHLAALYRDQGQYSKAEPLYQRAVTTLERGRGRLSRRGSDRAAVANRFAAPTALALVRARLGQVGAADVAERALARGFFEDLIDQLTQLLTPAEREQRAFLQRQLARSEAALETLASRTTRTGQVGELASLRRQHGAALNELAQFQETLDAKYGVKFGQPYPIQHIQTQLPADTALVAWLDQRREYWALVIRARGEPLWINLAANTAWSKSAAVLPADFAQACAERRSLGSLPRSLAEQRLAPLASALAAKGSLPAVRHLVVLTSPALAGVPLAALTDQYTISYAPSGTIYAWLRENRATFQQRWQRQPADLLALGDAVFEEDIRPAPTPPQQGVLLASVGRGSSAEKAGLKQGDVLLRYAETPLAGRAALSQAIQRNSGKPTTATVWRQGQELSVTLPPAKLGIQLDRRTPQQAFADAQLLRSGAEHWQPLPGTRQEVAAIARLVQAGGGTATALLGADASEPAVAALADKEGLKRYRYLHFATHGAMNASAAYASALILSQVGLPDPYEQLRKNAPVWDGKITAAEMLSWKLDADLVVLSACSTARGQDLGVEGTNSFAPALLLAGARSVVVSLWEVEDTATALLMTRFYQNILGQRPELKAPLPKAEALREAQVWLRTLVRPALRQLVAALPRGLGKKAAPVASEPSVPAKSTALPAPPSAPAADCPYAHPHFWAAFVLVGDPE